MVGSLARIGRSLDLRRRELGKKQKASNASKNLFSFYCRLWAAYHRGNDSYIIFSVLK
jgi:hypothetical protein